ncbi:hypothetical protein RCL1_007233 [Eukaryota sp. TZLM3-RCL]
MLAQFPVDVPDFYNRERLAALWKPFNKSDPVMVRDLTSFWKNTLKKHCLALQRCTFTTTELLDHYTLPQGLPRCLPSLIHELWFKSEVLEPWRIARSCLGSLPYKTVSFLVKSPVEWLWRKVWRGPPGLDEELVHVASCHHFADLLSSCFRTNMVLVPKVFTLTLLYKWIQSNLIELSQSKMIDIECVVMFLIKRGILKPIFHDESVSKFLIKDSTFLNYFGIVGFYVVNNSSNMTTNQFGVLLKLLSLEERISVEADCQSKVVDDVIHDIKDQLRQGNKTRAETLLHRKRLLQKNLDSKIATLNNLINLVNSINSTSEQGVLLQALEEGSELLSNICPDISEIDRITGQVQDAVELVTENDVALSRDQSNLIDTDFSDLERELKELETEMVIVGPKQSKSQEKSIVSRDVYEPPQQRRTSSSKRVAILS